MPYETSDSTLKVLSRDLHRGGVIPSRLGIREACNLFDLTPRALRFYEDAGLVEAHRDRNNHRYYDAEGRRRLTWIALLRRGDISVADIRRVLDAEDLEGTGRTAALICARARRSKMQREVDALDHLVAELSSNPLLKPKP